MNARETAWRVFAGELNSSSLEIKSEEEKSPSYLITPLGAKLNRILIAGVLLDKENTGTEEEPMWRGRIQDVSGNFFINVGRFQPNAAASMADLEAPSYVAVVGKVRTYTADDGRVFVTVRPETITNIDERTRNLWVLEAAQSTWDRLVKMKDMGELGVSMEVILKKAAENGMTPEEVEEASDALMDDGLAYEPKVGFLKAI
jgi:hypothetical protein